MTKDQPSYSQCPGECYDSFWEEENNQSSFDIKELTKGKRFDKDLMEWVKDNTEYQILYYKKGDLSLRWKRFKTMNQAIARAYEMIQTEEYTIRTIETVQPSIGQD